MLDLKGNILSTVHVKILQANGLTLIVSSPAKRKGKVLVDFDCAGANPVAVGPQQWRTNVEWILKDGHRYSYVYPPSRPYLTDVIPLQITEALKHNRYAYWEGDMGGWLYNQSIRPAGGAKTRMD